MIRNKGSVSLLVVPAILDSAPEQQGGASQFVYTVITPLTEYIT